jgi:uncharacterized membrane protein
VDQSGSGSPNERSAAYVKLSQSVASTALILTERQGITFLYFCSFWLSMASAFIRDARRLVFLYLFGIWSWVVALCVTGLWLAITVAAYYLNRRVESPRWIYLVRATVLFGEFLLFAAWELALLVRVLVVR